MIFVVVAMVILASVAVSAVSAGRRYRSHTLLRRVLDALLMPFHRLKLWPLFHQRTDSVHAAVEAAQKSTGLRDWGTPFPSGAGTEAEAEAEAEDARHWAMYSKVAASCKTERLTPVGHLIYNMQLSLRLADRLRLREYLQRVPEVARLPVKRPIFVVGLPRTGTTLTHQLLALHPAGQPVHMWELGETVPSVFTADKEALQRERAARYANCKQRFRLVKGLMGDEVDKVHKFHVDAPEECLGFLACEIPMHIVHLMGLWRNIDEAMSIDYESTYRLHRQFLQVMQWQHGERPDSDPEEQKRWILKCPFHLPFLDSLLKVYPDAYIVWTHRHPIAAVGSACSLYDATESMTYYFTDEDRKEMGPVVLHSSAVQVERVEQILGRLPPGQVQHVNYSDLVDDPEGTAQRVFESFGIDVTDEYRQRLNAYMENSHRERQAMRGKKMALHVYKSETYGLTDDEIMDTMGDYATKYQLQTPANKCMK